MLGKESSEVTKVPLTESRRLFVMESKLSERMERKDRKKMLKCRERQKEKSKRVKGKRTCAWHEDGMTDSRDLEP